jgi:hypothetical protein
MAFISSIGFLFLSSIAAAPAKSQAHLTLRWRGGAISELDLSLRSYRIPPIHSDEATIDLVRRLAGHYPDAVIAGNLNRQARLTATSIGSRPTRSVICAGIGQSFDSIRPQLPPKASR